MDYIATFEKCQKIIDDVGFPTDDELKRAKFAQEAMAAARLVVGKK